ncbi:MAG: hypothetical protein R3B97_06680 [Dehalococcoidia bacterium]
MLLSAEPVLLGHADEPSSATTTPPTVIPPAPPDTGNGYQIGEIGAKKLLAGSAMLLSVAGLAVVLAFRRRREL